MKTVEFLKIAAKDRMVGAFTVSTRFVAKKVAEEIKPDHKFIVEFGAGNGIITKGLLKKIPADGRIAAIELNKEFMPYLARINDKRLTVISGDALKISRDFSRLGFPKIDAVISGMPLSLFEKRNREELIRNTARGIRNGGVFIVYQYTPFFALPLLKKYFKKVTNKFEPRNLPPYFVMAAEK